MEKIVNIVAGIAIIVGVSLWVATSVDCGKVPLVGTFCVAH